MVGGQEAFVIAMIILLVVGTSCRDKIVSWFNRQ
jgi:hypothetical protein